MRFDLVSPCAECPFRNDIAPYLRPGRALEIANYAVRDDKTFACHKTTHRRLINRSQCAGALILAKKAGWLNAMFQIAERLGLLDSRNLKMSAPVYDSAADMFRRYAAQES